MEALLTYRPEEASNEGGEEERRLVSSHVNHQTHHPYSNTQHPLKEHAWREHTQREGVGECLCVLQSLIV